MTRSTTSTGLDAPMPPTASTGTAARPRAIGYASAAFGLQVFWATFIVFVPPLLERLGATPLLIGLVMAADPAAMIAIMPLAGLASDRLRTPLGGRLPIMIASALAAAAAMFALGRADSLAWAAACALAVCVATSASWAPYRALLADAFVPRDHAWVSGLQSLTRELGTLVVFVFGAWVLGKAAGLAFDFAAVSLLATTAWCCLALARRLPPAGGAEGPPPRVREEARLLPRRLLAAQMLWWFAIEAATVFAVLYIVHDVLGVEDLASAAGHAATASAIGVLAVLAVAGVVASLPVARLSDRFGRLAVVRVGLVAMLAASAIACAATSLAEAYVVAALFGVGLAVVQVLAFPLLLAVRPHGGGALASVYNLLIAGPQLVALIAVGAIAQATGTYRIAFLLGALALAAALLLLRGGERDVTAD